MTITTRKDKTMSTEHTYATEAAAKAARRAHINAGASVSLIGYDSTRNVYAYDVLDHAAATTTANIFAGKTEAEWLAEAAKCYEDRDDSWERSDSDGFLSQWANGVMAGRYKHCAKVAAAGGTLVQPALFDLSGNRIEARYVETRYGWTYVWDDEDGTHWFRESMARNPEVARRNNAKKGVYVGTARYAAHLNRKSDQVYAGDFIEAVDNGQ